MKLNKIDKIWSSANPLFKWRFRFAVIDYFATMAMWRNDFSSLFKRTVLDWIPVPLSVELSWITDSRTQDSKFPKQIVPGTPEYGLPHFASHGAIWTILPAIILGFFSQNVALAVGLS